MYARFQELMTTGYALANKLYFKEFDESEFERWIEDCQSLLVILRAGAILPVVS